MRALRLALVLLVGAAATGCYEFEKSGKYLYRLNRITGEVCWGLPATGGLFEIECEDW